MRHSALLLPLLLLSPARACLNDRDSDSLATQAKRLPDTLRVITGRFERNPPLYYEMRIRRALPQLKKDPRQFGLYDDIAVAYDRLHRDDEALAVMEKKRSLLPRFEAKNKAVKEAWYRYYANAGTFYAHRWLGAGAKQESVAEMKKGRDYIKRAIEIKPNAHFGREKYQLMTMEWIIAQNTRPVGTNKTLGEWIKQRDRWEHEGYSRQQQAREGLAGLVVLGAAWESPDIFEALAASLAIDGSVTLRDLALLRCRELLRSGKASKAPAVLNENVVNNLRQEWNLGSEAVNETNRNTLEELFPKLRREADEWAKTRQEYMLAKLKAGLHPDTDSQFWNGWTPAPPPDLEVPWHNDFQTKVNQGIAGALFLLAAMTSALVFGFLFLKKLWKRRLAQTVGGP